VHLNAQIKLTVAQKDGKNAPVGDHVEDGTELGSLVELASGVPVEGIEET
jgi:hypothetical protein